MSSSELVAAGRIHWRREAIAFFLLGILLIAFLTGDKELIQLAISLVSPVIAFYFGMRSRGD